MIGSLYPERDERRAIAAERSGAIANDRANRVSPPNYRVALGVAPVGRGGQVYDLRKLIPKASLDLTGFGGLTWSPDGTEVAFYVSAGAEILRVFALDADGGNTRMLAEIRQADSADLAWNPDR